MKCILIYGLLLKAWLMVCVICFICIDWWGQGWPMVACPFRALVVLYRMLQIFMKCLMYGLLYLQLSTLKINPFCAQNVPPDWVNTKAVDILTRYATRSSAAMVLTMSGEMFFWFPEGRYQLFATFDVSRNDWKTCILPNHNYTKVMVLNEPELLLCEKTYYSANQRYVNT